MSLVEQAMDKLRRSEAPPSTAIPVAKDRPPARSAAQPVVRSNVVVAIDRPKLRSQGYVPDQASERQFADHYRKIKRPIIARASQEMKPGEASGRLIVLASALPGDGKTFTSINLAFSMARERDISVLLVDADVAKPHISRIFGVDQEPGLMELLSEEVTSVESLVLQTDLPGLSLLPAGRPRDGATELLASARMGQIVEDLWQADPKRIILFDSPPLLISSESRALVEVAGQVVLVVRAGKTPKQAVLDAVGQFTEAKTVSLILNQGTIAASEGYYTYGYGNYGNNGSQRDV